MLNIRSVHFTSRVTFARLHNLMTCMHDVNNCLQFVFVMSISDQAVSSKPVIFDRKIVLGQNTIHKDCISNNKVRFSAESKFPLASILCCHVWGLTVVWYMYVLSTIIIKLIFNKLSYLVGLISSLLQFRDILQFSYSPGIVA